MGHPQQKVWAGHKFKDILSKEQKTKKGGGEQKKNLCDWYSEGVIEVQTDS